MVLIRFYCRTNIVSISKTIDIDLCPGCAIVGALDLHASISVVIIRRPKLGGSDI
jgi:hypothetical protein